LLNVTVSCDLLKMQELAKLMANSGGPPELTGFGKGLLNQLEIIGRPSPIDFTTADGLRINSTALSNKVVLVDFWAKWCPICVAAIPDIKMLYDQYHTNGLEIVGINFDDDPAQARQFCKEQDMPWPQYFGGYGADNQYGRDYGTVLPYVWLVDKKGIVRDIHGRVDLAAKVAKLMAE
jgi:thiol-disulfide isomerase/thioredoxin